MPDPLADIEFFQRQLMSSTAVPATAMVEFGSSLATIGLAAKNAAREMSRLHSAHDEVMASLLDGLLNPRSAVDRLADLVRDDAE